MNSTQSVNDIYSFAEKVVIKSMKILYRIYNSLTLDEYKFNKDENAFLYVDENTEFLTNIIGDLIVKYELEVDDSEWISPTLINDILSKFSDITVIESDLENDLLEVMDSVNFTPEEYELVGNVFYKKTDELIENLGYRVFQMDNLVVRQLDICDLREIALDYHVNNDEPFWLNRLSNDDNQVVLQMMEANFDKMVKGL